jgi:hypothetical protein
MVALRSMELAGENCIKAVYDLQSYWALMAAILASLFWQAEWLKFSLQIIYTVYIAHCTLLTCNCVRLPWSSSAFTPNRPRNILRRWASCFVWTNTRQFSWKPRQQRAKINRSKINIIYSNTFRSVTCLVRHVYQKSLSSENESWVARVHMRFFSTLMPWSNEYKSCNESWWELTGYNRACSENCRQNLNQFKVDDSWWEMKRAHENWWERKLIAILINSHPRFTTPGLIIRSSVFIALHNISITSLVFTVYALHM